MVNLAFLDVDTQNDFMLPTGRMYLNGAEKIRPALRKLYAFARKARIPVVASVDAYEATDAKMKDWPVHCIRGTDGQRKLPETRLRKSVLLPSDRKVEVPALRPGVQIVIEKTHHDIFSNPSARSVVEQSDVEHWAVFGVATDYGIRLASLGLLKLGRKVAIVSDAVAGVSREASRQALAELRAAGAGVRTADAVIRGFRPHPERKPRSK
jgi:nicotinamidase/pyrazinamidase